MMAAMADASFAVTARWAAAVRAQESRREDGLFHDRWAGALAGLEGEQWLTQRGDTPALSVMAIRTRFFDDFLMRVTGDHGVRQVVLLAAGFDTRAYRLVWPEGTRVFELDQPEVLGDKERIMGADAAKPGCVRHAVGADLLKPWVEPLARAGFRQGQPTAWLLEGFLFYLPPDAINRLLDEITRLAAPGSWMGFDIPNAATLGHPWTRPWIDMQARLGVPFLGTMDDPREELSARGWTATQVQAGDPQVNFGRFPYPPPPLEIPGMPRNWFVTARKEED